jgi:hypothetical protein
MLVVVMFVVHVPMGVLDRDSDSSASFASARASRLELSPLPLVARL